MILLAPKINPINIQPTDAIVIKLNKIVKFKTII